MNVAAMLLERARECPDAPALVETRRGQRLTLSFGELNARSGQAGAALRAHGVKKGSAVLLFHPPTADLYVALIGLLRIGAVAVVVEPAGGRKLLSDACNILPPAALFASPKAQLLRLMVPALRRIPVKFSSNQSILPAQLLVCDGDVPIDVADREICVDCSNDDLALVTFTSGSTGKPKGALRTHGILRAQYSALHDVTARCCNVDLVTLPIVVLSNLASGAATVLPNTELTRPRNVDAAAIAVQIESEAVTRITASPAVVERLADFALRRGTLINAVRLIVTGGGPVFPDIVARMRAAAPNSRVVSVYGSTEAEPIAHVIDSDVSAVDVSAMESGAGLLVGHPIAAVTIRIIPDLCGTPMHDMNSTEFDRLALPSSEPGEIVVTGDHVVRGYVNGIGDGDTKFRVDGKVWHRTGDMGRLDELGRLWLLGRGSAAVRDRRGVIHPFAVECAARSLLALREIALVQWKGDRVLIVCTPAGGTPTVAEVRKALPWAWIDRVIRLARIPTDARHNSKIDYPALMRALARGT